MMPSKSIPTPIGRTRSPILPAPLAPVAMSAAARTQYKGCGLEYLCSGIDLIKASMADGSAYDRLLETTQGQPALAEHKRLVVRYPEGPRIVS